MTARAARFASERRAAEVDLIVKLVLKNLALDNIMKTERECKRVYGVWFTRAVEAGKLVGVKQGNRTMYSVAKILALQDLELQQAERQAEDYIK